MIEIKDVCLSVGQKPLLDRVSLTCRPGTLTALVGPNGAGKSTLLSIIAGDVAPDRGEVSLNDRPMARLSVAKRESYCIFQRFLDVLLIHVDELVEEFNVVFILEDNLIPHAHDTHSLSAD